MVVNVSTTSKKPAKISLEQDEFIAMQDNRVKSLCFDWCQKNQKMMVDGKVLKQFQTQVARDIQEKYKVKGSKAGNIAKCGDSKKRDAYNQIKDALEKIEFLGNDGKIYICKAMCKEANKKELEIIQARVDKKK